MPLLELLREEVIRNSDLFACRISRRQPELIEGFNSRRPEKQLRRVHPYTIRLSLAQRLLTRPLLCGSVVYSLTRRQLSTTFIIITQELKGVLTPFMKRNCWLFNWTGFWRRRTRVWSSLPLPKAHNILLAGKILTL